MKTALKYVITILLGLAIGLLVLLDQNFFAQTNPILIYGILADAFTIPGILLTGIGLLVFVSNEGVFDGLTYAVKSFIGMFRKNMPRYGSFYDYREAKNRSKFSFGFLVICGLVFLLVAMVFYFIWIKLAP